MSSFVGLLSNRRYILSALIIVSGPGQAGCGCQYSEFGCCPDHMTQAGHMDLNIISRNAAVVFSNTTYMRVCIGRKIGIIHA
jgi:hypothetical protein